ncbi:hypothetical protein HYQ44_013832 [Verticillium longisporum]|nr:hypothetical protein HYQ44_013832 [Verticillium longisporum]
MPYFIYDDVDTSADDSSSPHSRQVNGIPNPEDAYAGDTEGIIDDGYWPEVDDEWLPKGKRSSAPQGYDDDAATLQPGDLLPWENDEIGLVQDERGKTLGRLLSPSVDTLTKSRGFTVTIPESTLVHPVSSFPGFCAPAPERKEKCAVEALLKNSVSLPSDDFFEIELGQFVVYRHSLSDRNKPPHRRQYPYEMRPLQTLCTKGAHSTLYADGILSHGDAKFFVRGIAFGELPLGNYGMAEPTVGDQIWISSTLNQRMGKKNIYYKLTTPAKEYARYHHGFLWIADLGKHVVDYMAAAGDKKRRVEFRHFKSHFHKWLIQAHGHNAVFNRWLDQYGRTDFRVAVNAYSDFIYKEAHGVLTPQQVFFHTFWKEIKSYTAYKPYGLVHNDASGRVSAGQSPEAEESGPGDTVQTPYDRDGVGNAFYISTYLQDTSGTKTCEPFSHERPFPKTFRQGMDPSEGFTKLQGFDLFCGGGNFGRGLEESGAIEMRWANDINMRAIHTYMANLDDPSRVSPFPGSIDDLARMALEGRFASNVPPVGEVDFVSGGSPCPGFSRLTVDKTTPNQRKNQSLVAAFASFIDIYRPKYGLLENVVEIIQGRKTREEDVFCQLICAIVGMGYQTHFFLLDAWTFGSPQSRSRIFLAFAAPGLRLPEVPMQSHLPLAMRSRSLGLLSNGEPMLRKTFMPTAFASVTARQALADLPDIADAKADCCIPFPDHRQSIGVTQLLRPQLSCIPTRPWGLNLSTAYDKGHGPITAAELSLYPQAKRRGPSSKAFGRLHPDKLMGTITTTPSPSDGYGRAVLHWEQNRILTVMEARRAQGFRDHEVILGTPAEQWKTVGNSVAREVSIALGLSFREAWLGSLIKGDEHLPLPRHIVRQPTMGGVEVKQAKTQRQKPQADDEATLVRHKREDTPDTPLRHPVIERFTATHVSHSYPTPEKHGTPRRVITPRRASSRRSSPMAAHGMTAYDPHDESIFGSEMVLPIRKPRGNNELATDWRGRRSVDETYAPPSDYESERTATTSQDPEVWTPEPSRDLSTTPATSAEGEPRVDSAASARKRPANSVIIKLFASKRKTAGEEKREAKRTCLP